MRRYLRLYGHFVRFSFGPLGPESFEENMQILEACVG